MKKVALPYIAGILITFGLSFLISAGFSLMMRWNLSGAIGLICVVCWAFGFAWSWKLALGLWVVMLLISSAVKSHNSRT